MTLRVSFLSETQILFQACYLFLFYNLSTDTCLCHVDLFQFDRLCP